MKILAELPDFPDFPGQSGQTVDETANWKKIGELTRETYHPVSGTVYLKDQRTIVIDNFIYDGEGPDAFFMVRQRKIRFFFNNPDPVFSGRYR